MIKLTQSTCIHWSIIIIMVSTIQQSLSEKCKEVGTDSCCTYSHLIRIILYHLVHALFGTAIPTLIHQLFVSIVFYTCIYI